MAEPSGLEEQRENWGSRAGFVLAAIGSAVGLGNLWGFPYKVYSYGGGAFLIPYIAAMLLIGIPLLIAEFSLGHLTQRATPDAFGRANRKFAFVGWWQILLSFIIITYYAVILAYCFSFTWYSIQGIFTGELPWAGQGIEGVKKAETFFFSDYLAFNESFQLGRLQTHIILALAITWLAMYLCIFRGVKLVGKVVLWTVPLPWLMLLILTVRGLTLPGAIQGLEYYLEPNWSKLADPITWRWAFGQMFFSMSLAFGIMITYSSFLHRKSDLNNNAAIIGLADMGTSFVAGLAVFATLGGMAFATQAAGVGVPVESVAKSGPSLAFVAFPYALAQLPHAPWFSLLFFGSLLLLGIDSAFSITECVLASVVDKTGWKRGKTLIAITLIGFAIGVVFCTQGGLSWLGTFDDFINGTWGITLTALLECFILGWLFRIGRLRDHANERSDWRIGPLWTWSIRLVIPVVLAALFAWSLFDGLSNPRGYVYDYAPDVRTLSLPVDADIQLPDRPLLEVAFVADFTGKAECTLKLDETDKPSAEDSSLKDWKILLADGSTTQPTQLKEIKDFKAQSLAGKILQFTTKKASPSTAYTVRYRWTSRPQTDPKTGLPVSIDEKDQPAWKELTKLTTQTINAGLNIGNAVGLGLMALVPLAAILFAAIRFRRNEPGAIHVEYSDHRPRGRAVGTLALLLGLGGIVSVALAFVRMLNVSEAIRGGAAFDTVMPQLGILPESQACLIAGGLAGLVALLLGGMSVMRSESQRVRASMLSRLGAGVGVLGLGLCAGVALAYAMMTVAFPVKPNEYDNELSGVSYVILGCVLGLIVVGLGWCFYRALKAAGMAEVPQEQIAEEVDGE